MEGKIGPKSVSTLCTEKFFSKITDKVSRFCGLYTCCRCNTSLYTLCVTCASSILYATPSCIICEKFSHIGSVHASCQPKSLYYTYSLSCFNYTKTIKCLLHVYKYEAAFQYQRVLEELITQYIRVDPFKILVSWSKVLQFKRVALIPVPMTSRKESERGFSPAFELAIMFSRHIKLRYSAEVEIFKKILCKVNDSSAQATKNKRQRLLSLQNAYVVNAKEEENFKKFVPDAVIVVDDIVTTGATTNIVIERLVQNSSIKVVLKSIPLFRISFATA